MASAALQGGHLSQRAGATDPTNGAKQNGATPNAAPHSSLKAPNRNRSISVDDFIDDVNMQRPSIASPPSHEHPHAESSSSESDGDENEIISKRHSTQNINRGDGSLQHNLRTSSAMSLESLQNESECSDGVVARKRTSMEALQTDAGLPSGPLNQNHLNEFSVPSKRLKASIGPRNRSCEVKQVPDSHFPTEGAQSRTNGQSDVCVSEPTIQTVSLVPGDELPISSSRDALTSTRGKCAAAIDRSSATNITQSSIVMNATSGLELISAQENIDSGLAEETIEKGLVNIAAVPDTDGSGWDRFIFFSHRVQRFFFPHNTFLSAFSPFAAVASDMEEVTPANVCAVCGAGGVLMTCSRCPLAFHSGCVDPLRRRLNNSPWFCDACFAVKGADVSNSWEPSESPPILPLPSTGFGRLIADAEQGNPIDLIFNPTLFKYYKSECGNDWLRCCKCQQVVIAGEGVLAESVHIPFECCYAFWKPEHERKCAPPPRPGVQRNVSSDVAKVEDYIRQRSRRRNALFYNSFGEEDRCDYGFPSLSDIIVIDDDASLDGKLSRKPANGQDTNEMETGMNVKPPSVMRATVQASKGIRKLAPMVQVVRPMGFGDRDVVQGNTDILQNPVSTLPAPLPSSLTGTAPNISGRASTDMADVEMFSNPQPDRARLDQYSNNTLSQSEIPKKPIPQVSSHQHARKHVVSDDSIHNARRNVTRAPDITPDNYQNMGQVPQALYERQAALQTLMTEKLQATVNNPMLSSQPDSVRTDSARNPSQTAPFHMPHTTPIHSVSDIAPVARRERGQASVEAPHTMAMTQRGNALAPHHTILPHASPAVKHQISADGEGHQLHASTRPIPALKVPMNVHLPNHSPVTNGSSIPNLQADPHNSQTREQMMNQAILSAGRSVNAGHISRDNSSNLPRETTGLPVSITPDDAPNSELRANREKQEQIPESCEPGGNVVRNDVPASVEDSKDGVKVEPEQLQSEILQFIASLELDLDTEDILTDLALANDKPLNQLYIAFRKDDARFRRHATRLARRAKTGANSKAEWTGTVANVATKHQPLSAEGDATIFGSGAQDGIKTNLSEIKNALEAPAGEESRMDFDAHIRTLRARQIRDIQELEATFKQQLDDVPMSGIPPLQQQQHQIRTELTSRQEEEMRGLMKTISNKYEVS